MQFDDEGRERVVSFQSHQMKPAEKNYPVHDKELLAMRDALIMFKYFARREDVCNLHRSHIIAYRSSLVLAYGTVVVILRRV